MSSAPPTEPLPGGLFTGLVDDAAVFPPGSSPLADAVAAHLRMRACEWYAGIVGPLLVPAGAAAALAETLGDRPAAVGLISRPGAPAEALVEATAILADSAARVVGLEAGWAPDWRERLPVADPSATDRPGLALEIPRGPDREVALTDLRAARAQGFDVVAKLRTGATEAWAWPDEREVADFLIDVCGQGLAFKLTGGLHHLVRCSAGHLADPGSAGHLADPDSAGQLADPDQADPNHGLLNVIVAVDAALRGTDRLEVAGLLARRDRAALIAAVGSLTLDRIDAIRRAFRSFGCCTVTDPIDELAAAGLAAANSVTAPHSHPRPEGVSR